jgi:hypothetical protein
MKEFKQFFRSLILPLIIIVVICSPIIFYNVIVDPYKVFFAVYPMNEFEPNKQIMKMQFILKNKSKFDSFIFGSSRVNFINPDKIPIGNYYNMTYSSGIPFQHFKNIKYMVEKGVPIKNLLIGIDQISFFSSPDYPGMKALMRHNYPINISEKISFFNSYFFIRPLWSEVKANLRKVDSEKTKSIFSDFYRTGTVIPPINDAAKGDLEIEKKINEKIFNFPYDPYQKDPPVEFALAQIDSIVQFSKRHSINLKLFINPIHHISYTNLNLDQYYYCLRKLAEMTEFYDFSGINSVTINNNNYFETSHYHKAVGNLIIGRLFGLPNPQIPNDFGHLVNNTTIDDHIKLHKKQLSEYLSCFEWPIKEDKPDFIEKYKNKSSAPVCSIESINGVSVENTTQTILITTPFIKLQGWAFDRTLPNRYSKVYIALNGKIFETNYGKTREDIAIKFENQNYLNSGWEVSIPSSILEKEIKNCSIYLVSAKELSYSVSKESINMKILYSNKIPENLIELGETNMLSVDLANGDLIKNNPVLISGNYLNLRGWAIENNKKNITGGVIVNVDSVAFLSQFKFSQPNLLSNFNELTNTDAGWGITIPCENLQNGKHELTFKVLNNDRSGYYTTNRNIQIYYNKNININDFTNKNVSYKKTAYAIDVINSERFNKIKTPVIIREKQFRVLGWAIDKPENKVANDVFIKINNKLYLADYGTKRVDISKHFKDNKFMNSGWNITIPVSSIGKGTHKFSVIIISENGTVYTDNKEIPFVIL